MGVVDLADLRIKRGSHPAMRFVPNAANHGGQTTDTKAGVDMYCTPIDRQYIQ